MFTAGAPSKQIPRMYKLHGSTNWSFGGVDAPPNDQIVLTRDGLDWCESPPRKALPPRWGSIYQDLVPLIVPPTFTKGSYYSNRALSSQWLRGAEELKSATSLTVLGYSFPEGDLITRQWLVNSYQGPIKVVDSNKKLPAELRKSLPPTDRKITGARSIQSFAESTSMNLLRWRRYVSENDTLGMQIDLTLNGQDLLKNVDRANPPWSGKDIEWLKNRLDSIDPNIQGLDLKDPKDGSTHENWLVCLQKSIK